MVADALSLTIQSARQHRAASGERAEHRRRLVGADVLLYALVQASVGLAWDIRWHGAVGRDSFWSPPHLLMYSGITVAGLVCLAIVLQTMLRYRHGQPAVTDATTVAVCGAFHGPLGFVLAGFGLLTMLAAAPFDNFWHELYGIDVTLWAPFHVMGLVGGALAALGAIYAVAAEAARARSHGWVRWRLGGYSGLDLLALFAISGLLTGLLTFAQPAAWQYPTLDIGRARVLSYPGLLALAVGLLGVVYVRLAGRPGAATLMIAMYAARQLVLAILVPWAIRVTVAQQGLDYRVGTVEPGFSGFSVAVAAAFLVPALLIDLVAVAERRREPAKQGSDLVGLRRGVVAGLTAAVPLFALGVWLVSFVMQHASVLGAPLEILIPPLPSAAAVSLALPITLALGALGGALGSGLGAHLRLNTR